MEDVAAELVHELKALRRGPGVRATDILPRVGPRLRAIAEIGPEDGLRISREKLTAVLDESAQLLPGDLKMAAMVGLGLEDQASSALLNERIAWLGAQIQRDTRTARRRMDVGLERLAEIIASAAPVATVGKERPGPGWQLASSKALLLMNKPRPEATEVRGIVSERDGLDVISTSFSLPRHPSDDQESHDLAVEVLYGGRLVARDHPTESRFLLDLELPAPLRLGEYHEYSILYRVPDGQPMAPHYVFVPRYGCDHFDLRVRFDLAKQPRKIWLVSEAFHRDVDERGPTDQLLEPDRFGEVHIAFDALLPGFGYGIQWEE